jgi:serine O-acetyltransferase
MTAESAINAGRPGIVGRIREDIQNVFDKDPAARSVVEILTCYPGLHAIWLHRIAHALWGAGLLFLARLLSSVSRFLTGIEIHPGATIGRRIFIDHGMGVVIGETAEIGDDVLIYKGVVLGGTTLEKRKRHPTIADGVVIGSNAAVLGDILVGRDARVGSGAVVIKPVPAGSTVVGVPGRIVRGPGAPKKALLELRHADLPDPVAEAIRVLLDTVEELEQRTYRIEDTCSRLQVWSQEEFDALKTSREHLRTDWLDACDPLAADSAGGNGDDMGKTGGAEPWG